MNPMKKVLEGKSYPIDEILPRIKETVLAGPSAVLQAPPGSGKTTRAPLALLEVIPPEKGRILMLEPRRIAAVSAARWMARTLGEEIGGTLGYSIRFDSRVSEKTRIEVVTEGILTRRLQADPGLEGVAMVIFDEFHERSLQADLALALCLDIRRALREDLKILVMSATLDCGPVASLLGGAPVISSAGEAFPVEERYLPGRAGQAPSREDHGSGPHRPAGDLRRPSRLPARRRAKSAPAANPCGPLWKAKQAGISIHPLYGDLPFEEQERAILPSAKAKDRSGDEHRRNEPDHRRGEGGDRQRPDPEAAVRPGHRHEPPGHGPGFQGRGRAAQRPGRPSRSGRLLPSLQPPCLSIPDPFHPAGNAHVRPLPPGPRTGGVGSERPGEALLARSAADGRMGIGQASSHGSRRPRPRGLGHAGRPVDGPAAAPSPARPPVACGPPNSDALASAPTWRPSSRSGTSSAARHPASWRTAKDSISAEGSTFCGSGESKKKPREDRSLGPAGRGPGVAADPAPYGRGFQSMRGRAGHDLIPRLLLRAFPDRIAKRREEGDGSFRPLPGKGRAASFHEPPCEEPLYHRGACGCGGEGRRHGASGRAGCRGSPPGGTERERSRRMRRVEWDKQEGRIVAILEERLGAVQISARPFAPAEEEVAPLLCEAIRSGSARIVFSEEARQLQGRVSLMRKDFPCGELAGPVGSTSPLRPRGLAHALAEGNPHPGTAGRPGSPAAPARPSFLGAAAASRRARPRIPASCRAATASPWITPPETSRSWP